MRLRLPFISRIAAALRERDWFTVGLELFLVVLGVLLGLEASRWAAAREENVYREKMVAALDQVLLDYAESGQSIHDRIARPLAEFERAIAAGERPVPPFLRFPRLDRPPTRAWDAIVSTGFARAVEPELVFRLAMHFSRADSFGDRYARYNRFTEDHILPNLGSPSAFYDGSGKLARPYAQHLERLREIQALNDEMTTEAIAIRKALREGR